MISGGQRSKEVNVKLPKPVREGRLSLEETLAARRSVREFADQPLREGEWSQLLWAAQGITHPDSLRTTPSAGALYPLELYMATEAGLFHYDPRPHRLRRQSGGDLRRALSDAAHAQGQVLEAPAVFVMAGVFDRIASRYGAARAPRYVWMEAGHAAQNLLLEAVALGLGAVPVGAFDDARVGEILGLPPDQRPLYLIPVGRPRVP
jgi:SagB-type dehydrogenase family enzyme